jgi:hypothetical protein
MKEDLHVGQNEGVFTTKPDKRTEIIPNPTATL